MNTTFTECPLCGAAIQMKQINPQVNHGTLADVFGHGIMLQTAVNQVMADNEKLLEAHLKEHSLVEWVTEIVKLRRLAPNREDNMKTQGVELDAARLDYLTRYIRGDELRRVGVVWGHWSPQSSRAAIDAAIAKVQP